MAAQLTGGFRGFVQKPLGKVALVAISFLATAAAFIYVTPILGIPVFLVAGLALPILSGVKRPRFLALSGLVVLLVLAPVANVYFTDQLLAPVPAASSSPAAPDGNGGSVLQNATLSPFTGGAGTNFTWTVMVDPNYLASGLTSTNWSNDSVRLYLSTCPGATNATASYCASGYPFVILYYNFTAPPTSPTPITFHYVVRSNGIWAWQMGLHVQNRTTSSYSDIFLVGDPTWNGIEGPVVGGFSTVYVALITDIFFTVFLYLGLPFYFLLLIYMVLKNRERRRKEALQRAPRAVPPSSEATGGTGGTSPATPLEGGNPVGPADGNGRAEGQGPLASSEKACPSCGAVVYPSETKCWKCGATLQG